MADEKISQLDAVTDVLDDDDYVLARAGSSKRITGASLKADLGGSVSFLFDQTIGLGLDNGPQTIANGGDHAILYDTVESVSGDSFGHDLAAGTITVLNDGLYLVQFEIQWADSSDGLRVPTLVFTPSSNVWDIVASNLQSQVPTTPTPSGFTQDMPAGTLTLAAGTVVSLTVSQNSGAGLDVNYSELTMARLI